MPILKKIIELAGSIASSLLKNEDPAALQKSDLFTDADKRYIMDNLTDENLLKERSELMGQINKKEDWAKIQKVAQVPVRKLHLWRYAAAAVLIFAFFNVFYNKPENLKKSTPQVVAVGSDIKAGSDKATLTREDGSTIVLEKGKTFRAQDIFSNGKELTYSKKSESKTAAVVYNYLTIPRGGQFSIKLSDGTQVWLNSESKLKFPVNFIPGQLREVELVYGEAYFDVSPSTMHKGSHFNVLTSTQNVEVLGTEFNIKAYKDEDIIYTTLVEGKVSLSGSSTTVTKKLAPGERSVFNLQNNNMTVGTVDVYNEVAWKDGVFTFNEMPLKEIMKVLARWYDVKIIFSAKATENMIFNGILDKNQKIEEILAIISNTNNVKYEINQKTIIFK